MHEHVILLLALVVLSVFGVVVGEQLYIARREKKKEAANERMRIHIDRTYAG
ncbi:MAG TPA: hypothetical protein VMA75_02985 [Candidatus Paceibacterota bacterium]|nr:hypothetical protein [Candidatus Paceibacterota bacterium]